MTGDLADKLDKLISDAEDTPSADAPPSSPPTDGANILTSLLSNPEIMSKLPTIMSAAGGILGAGKSDGEGARKNVSHHAALLCALKPYLNSDRKRAAEYIINFLRISDAMRSIPAADTADKKGDSHVQ